jgi:PAS domain S-box-containing protein
LVSTFFIYGLAFFILGISIYIYPKKESRFKLADNLWLIALFGITHGINEWIDMFILIQQTDLIYLKIIRLVVLPVSLCFLFQFGINNYVLIKNKNSMLKTIPVILFVLWGIITLGSHQRFLTGDIWARYIIGFPGIFLTGYAFSLHRPEFKEARQPEITRNLNLVVVVFFFYALFSLIVPEAGFFPASIINYNMFLDKTGIPVQILRALCAVLITYAIIQVLRIFEWEAIETLKKERNTLEDRVHERTATLQEINTELESEITERKIIERKLDESHRFLQNIIDCIAEPIMVINTDYTLRLMNRAAEEFSKISVPSTCHQISHNQDTPCNNEDHPCPLRKVRDSGKPVTVLHEHIRHDGEKRSIEIVASPLWGQNGSFVGVIESHRDITERKRMEEELLKAQKIESIGILAGGIAHDFNNLLTAILGNISLAHMDINPDDKTYKMLADAEEASLRAKDLANQLITFSKGGMPVKDKVYPDKLIKDSADFTLRGSNVTCELSIPEDLWPVELDVGLMRQAINNLLQNAKEAMSGRGIIKIRAENVTVKEEEGLWLGEDRYIKISIADQGEGIPKENLQKIFDPYFTTKEMGSQKGMGLGLAVCYSIIKNHNGFIGVESQVETGTTFYIYLPAL